MSSRLDQPNGTLDAVLVGELHAFAARRQLHRNSGLLQVFAGHLKQKQVGAQMLGLTRTCRRVSICTLTAGFDKL